MSNQKTKASTFGWFICLLGAIFYCYEYLLRVSPSVMTHDLMLRYSLDATGYGNLQALYYYIYVPLQLLVGLFFDRFGLRRLLSVAILFCTIGIYFFGNGHSLALAQFGRLLVGLGSSFAFVGLLKLAAIWLPAERFALVSGLATALGTAGGIIGDFSLTALVETLGWQATCYWASAFGLLLCVLVFTFVRDDVGKRKRKTPQMIELETVKLDSIQRALPEILRLLARSQFWVNAAIGCLLYLPLSAFAELWAIPFLRQAMHLTSQQAATGASLVFFAWVVGAPFMGWFSDFIRQRRVLLTTGGVGAAIFMSVVLYMPNLTMYSLYVSLFLFGFFSSSQVLVFPVVRDMTPRVLTGTAFSITNFVVMISGFTVPLIGRILDLTWSGGLLDGVRSYSIEDFQLGLMVLPIGLIVAAVLSFFLHEHLHHKPG